MRENTAYIRPPRALWVPFELGRPFGTAGDTGFQTDVLRSVLSLLERTDGPVILDDFPKDAPDQGNPENIADNMEGMVCPIPLRKPDRSSEADIIQQVLAEIDQLAPWQALFRESTNRSTVGVSSMNITDAARFLGELLATGRCNTVVPSDWGTTMRFATEDLRNFYLEAASMRPGGAASTRQLADWFWGETSAGALLLALHPICMASDNEGLQRVADTLMIPRAQQHRL